MHAKHLAAGALALAAALSLTGTTRAGDDDLKLRLPGGQADTRSALSADTLNLKATSADLDAEVQDARYRGFYGGYRGGFYGYRGGLYFGGYRGFYGGYRGGFYGGYRGFYPRFHVGFRRPVFYGGYAAYPSFYSYGYSTYYYPNYTAYAYAYPCSMPTVDTTTIVVTPSTVRVGPPSYSLTTPPPGTTVAPGLPGTNTLPAPREERGAPMPPATTPGTTFPYDGGPKAPVPMPPADPAEEGKVRLPRRPAVVEDMVVSLKLDPSGEFSATGGTGKWSYPAYGEAPRRANGSDSKKPSSSSSSGFSVVPSGRTPAR